MDRNFKERMDKVFSGNIFENLNNLNPFVPPEKVNDEQDDFDEQWMQSSLSSQYLADFDDLSVYPESV